MSATKKNIALRVDASAQMGLGHFMRCLTLADALKRQGDRTRFLSRNLPDNLQELLRSRGHELSVFTGTANHEIGDELAHAGWLECTQQQDADDTSEALCDLRWDWLVVDHYALDARWEKVLRASAQKLLIIDDIADRHHDADLLLDQNLYQDMQRRYAGLLNVACVQLLGPQYALLRTEFVEQRGKLRPRDGTVTRILIFFGGTDVSNETGKALEAVDSLKMPELQLDIVIGAANAHSVELEAFCKKISRARVHRDVSNMAELMNCADLSIGAAGTATWERCAVGLPALVMAVAKNQEDIAQGVDRVSAQLYLGIYSEVSAAAIASALKVAIKQPHFLRDMSTRALTLVDACGAGRVVSAMEGTA